MSRTSVYQNRLQAIRLTTARKATAEWAALDNIDRPNAEPFARSVAAVVAAGQLLTARITSGYLAQVAKTDPLRITADQVTGTAARQGVDPLELYQRPFGVAWKALGDGKPIDIAIELGRQRLEQIATADVWLAMRAATEIVDDATPKITGWVRVADAGACDLCAAADGTPLASPSELAGHPGCGCTAEPTFAGTPKTSAEDPRAVVVHEHGELGAVLTSATQSFAS